MDALTATSWWWSLVRYVEPTWSAICWIRSCVRPAGWKLPHDSSAATDVTTVGDDVPRIAKNSTTAAMTAAARRTYASRNLPRGCGWLTPDAIPCPRADPSRV